MRLERQFAVPASPAAVWDFFWDVPTLASCIPGCVGVTPAGEPDRYTALVEVAVGRFRVQFELTIDVVDSHECQSVRARAQGRDRVTRSTLVSDLDFNVAEDGSGGAIVTLGNELQVFGRLASLGHSMIKRRSEDLMDEFADGLRARLGQDESSALSSSGEQPACAGPPRPER